MRSKSPATAEVFLAAFKKLPKADRDAVLLGIVDSRALRRDLVDLAAIAARRKEPSRPLRDYLAERRRK